MGRWKEAPLLAGLFLTRELVSSFVGTGRGSGLRPASFFPTVVVADVRQGDFLGLFGGVVSSR